MTQIESLEARRLLSAAVHHVPPPGRPDLTFGSRGVLAATGMATAARDVAVQPDGKVIVAGTESGAAGGADVRRYNADGTPDTSFGEAGQVTFAFDSKPDAVDAITLQPDGRILLVGHDRVADQTGNTSSLLLARLNTDGSPDASFGSGGKVALLIGTFGVPADLLVQPDGKIVVAGQDVTPAQPLAARSGPTLATGSLLLARFNADGSPDPAFGMGEQIKLSTPGPGEAASAVAIQSDGKLVVAVEQQPAASGPAAIALLRFNTDGTPDDTFGQAGRVLTGLLGNAADLAIQRNDDILLTADRWTNGRHPTNSFSRGAVVLRFTPEGTPDLTFGSRGRANLSFGAGANQSSRILAAPDGSTIVAGWAVSRTPHAKATYRLVRLSAIGRIDRAFAAREGKPTVFSDTALTNAPVAAALGTDGTLVTAAGDNGFVARRLFLGTANGSGGSSTPAPSAQLDPGFGSGGVVSLGGLGLTSRSIAVQSDGKTIVGFSAGGAAGFLVRRYNVDGSLDATFGNGGFVSFDFGENPALSDQGETLAAIALQPDGKIVLVGNDESALRVGATSNLLIARLDANGMLDPTFGTGGKVVSHFGAEDFAQSVLVQPDGRIVVAAADAIGEEVYHFVNGPSVVDERTMLVRYNADGTLDNSFGAGGLVSVDRRTAGVADAPVAMALQSGGRIVVAADEGPIDGAATIVLFRFKVDGSADAAFGSGGEAQTGIAAQDADVVAQGDRVVLVATRWQNDGAGQSVPTAAVVERFNDNGTLDPTFGLGGAAIVAPAAGGQEGATSGALTPDGHVLVAGWSLPAGGGAGTAVLRRFTADGQPDASFGDAGRVQVNSIPVTGPAYPMPIVALAIDPVGGAILASDAATSLLVHVLGT